MPKYGSLTKARIVESVVETKGYSHKKAKGYLIKANSVMS